LTKAGYLEYAGKVSSILMSSSLPFTNARTVKIPSSLYSFCLKSFVICFPLSARAAATVKK
jgi:hypothetical protein